MNYGKELILDLHECNPKKFNRKSLRKFFGEMCELLNMEACDLHFWDYHGYAKEYEDAPDHLKGTTAIQFISTSNITIHCLDVLKSVYLNIFSCKNFDRLKAMNFCKDYFEGRFKGYHFLTRG